MAYDLNKLTKLGALKELAERINSGFATKGELDAVSKRVDKIASDGGEPNELIGVKVNGVALDIAEKMVDILIDSGSENGTLSVAGVNIAITGLAALAYKEKVSEDELDAALTAVIAAKASADDVTTLQAAVKTLIGSTSGDDALSVREIAAQEVAKIVADAGDNFDTLKDIADWISGHTTDAAAMSSDISKNKSDIAALTELVGTIPGTSSAKTIVEYISDVANAIDLSEYAKTEDLDGLIKLDDISVTTTGNGTVVSAVSYDKSSGVITVTKGITALTAADIATDEEVAEVITEVFGE